MKDKRGFGSIGVLIIVLVILVIGGIAYVVGKNSNTLTNSEQNLPADNGNVGMANPASVFCVNKGYKSIIVNNPDGSQGGDCVFPNGNRCDEWAYFRGLCDENTNPSPISSSCNKNSPPSITVLSPNGGETYTSSQQISVTWKSCNIATGNVAIGLKNIVTGNENFPIIALDNGKINLNPFPDGKYKAVICSTVQTDYAHSVNYNRDCNVSDYSDDSFTINTPKISTTLPAPYISAQSNWLPVIQSSNFKYSCTPFHSNAGGGTNVIEKMINNRTFCVGTSSEGAAGSIYYTYTYTTFGVQGTSENTTFILRYQNCGVWQGDGTSKYTDCQTAQSNFDSDLDAIIASLKW